MDGFVAAFPGDMIMLTEYAAEVIIILCASTDGY